MNPLWRTANSHEVVVSFSDDHVFDDYLKACLIGVNGWLTYYLDAECDMKPEQIYQELRDLAEKLAIVVSEQNLRTAGIKVKSGLCRVRGKDMFIMDKHQSIHKKIRILAAQLAGMPHENVYVVPTVRDILEKYGEKSKNK